LNNSYVLKDRFSHIWSYPSRQILFKEMDNWSINLENKTILDYGCGRGDETLKYIKNGAKKVIGIDISPIYIADAQNKAVEKGFTPEQCKFLSMDAHKLEFAEDSFDLVIGQGILHHLEPEIALGEIYRVLKKDGIVVLQEPLADNPLLRMFRFLTPNARTIDEAPFTGKQIKSFESSNNWKSHTTYCGVIEAPIAMITSILMPNKPKNWLLRISHKFELLLRSKNILTSWNQYVLLVLEKK
jgi:ubiquinone/menaquinone biosynthesis C-methylase UbiE